MNRAFKPVLGTISLLSLLLAILVLQAGGWDNFKLRYFHLTSYLHDQERELEDIRADNRV